MKPFNFIHIPKCGGTTLVNILKPQYNLIHIDGECRVDGYKNYDVIFGHHSYKVYDHLPMITWIRNPVERVISHYFKYADKRGKVVTYPDTKLFSYDDKRMDILDFAKKIPNIMTAYMGNDPSIFSYIGVLEHYNQCLKEFSERFEFEIPPDYKQFRVGTNKSPVDDDIRQEIANINKLDVELYEEIINEKCIGSFSTF
jgi:hypothetical protein